MGNTVCVCVDGLNAIWSNLIKFSTGIYVHEVVFDLLMRLHFADGCANDDAFVCMVVCVISPGHFHSGSIKLS